MTRRLVTIVAVLLASLAVGVGIGNAQERTLAEVDSALAALEARVRAAGLLLAGGVLVPPPDPNPDPGDSIPPIEDDRLVRGRFPAVGYAADVFKGCAPDSGDWTVEVVTIGRGDSLARALEALTPDADLVAVVFLEGGEYGEFVEVRGNARQDCIAVMGHTAPAVPWFNGMTWNSRNGRPIHDVGLRGLGFLSQGVHTSLQLVGVSFTHADLITAAFADDNQVAVTSDGAGDHNTLARVVNGPTANGNRGNGGGLFDGQGNTVECAAVTWAYVANVEPNRRAPLVECSANLTNILTYNSTDCGRIQKAGVALNIRSYLCVGGPVTGCDTDRAVTFFDQILAPTDPMAVYLEGVRSVARPGCPWTQTTTAWGAPHTVFHYSRAGTAVPFEGHGVLAPHAGPEWEVTPLPESVLEEATLASIGATWGLDCEGRWTSRANRLDEVNLGRMRARAFAPTPWASRAAWEAAHGALAPPRGTPCPDSGGNGIPDGVEAWWGHSDPGRLMPDGRPAVLHWFEGRAAS